MKKRLVSALLALCMVLTMLPAVALASSGITITKVTVNYGDGSEVFDVENGDEIAPETGKTVTSVHIVFSEAVEIDRGGDGYNNQNPDVYCKVSGGPAQPYGNLSKETNSGSPGYDADGKTLILAPVGGAGETGERSVTVTFEFAPGVSVVPSNGGDAFDPKTDAPDLTVPNAIKAVGFAWDAAEATDAANRARYEEGYTTNQFSLLDASVWVKFDASVTSLGTAKERCLEIIDNKSTEDTSDDVTVYSAVIKDSATGNSNISLISGNDNKGVVEAISFASRGNAGFQNWAVPGGSYTVNLHDGSSNTAAVIGTAPLTIDARDPAPSFTVTSVDGTTTNDGKIVATYSAALLGDYILKVSDGTTDKKYATGVYEANGALVMKSDDTANGNTDMSVSVDKDAGTTTFTVTGLSGGSYAVELLYRGGAFAGSGTPQSNGEIEDGSIFVETTDTTNLLTGIGFGWTAEQANAVFNKTNSIDATMWVRYGTLTASKTYKLEITDADSDTVIFKKESITDAANGEASPFSFANSNAVNSAYPSWQYPTGDYVATLYDVDGSNKKVGLLTLTVDETYKPAMRYKSRTADSVTVTYVPLLGEYWIEVTGPNGYSKTYNTGVDDSTPANLLKPGDMAISGNDITLSGLNLSAYGSYTVKLSYYDNPNSNNSTYADNVQEPIRDEIASATFTISAPQQNRPAGGIGGGSSSSETKYPVNTGNAANGVVEVSSKDAAAGTRITVTTSPNAGYETASVSVTDADGNAVAVTKTGENTYVFTMPDGYVNVSAAFAAEHACHSEDYWDLDVSQWYHEATDYVLSNGLMNGMGGGRFGPNETTNRAMIVTILHRLENEPNVGRSGTFSDVAAGQWYANAVEWAAGYGVVTGYGGERDGEFGPMDSITREQLATMLYRYANYKGYDVSARGSLGGYRDGGDVSGWAKEAMEWAVGVGLFQGDNNQRLNPGSYARRSEVAQIMMRFCEDVLK